jgi:hypothetical protein
MNEGLLVNWQAGLLARNFGSALERIWLVASGPACQLALY